MPGKAVRTGILDNSFYKEGIVVRLTMMPSALGSHLRSIFLPAMSAEMLSCLATGLTRNRGTQNRYEPLVS